MLLFLATESWYSMELTMSKRGKIIYKYLLIDYEESNYEVVSKRHPYRNLIPNLGQEMIANPAGNAEINENEDQYGSLVNQQVYQQMAPDMPLQGNVIYKRRKIDVGFHLICALVGIFFTMTFSNWTVIYGYVFTASDIVDIDTVWVRFGGTVTGMVYLLIVGLVNACNRGNEF